MKTKTEIKKELERETKIFLAIRMLEEWDGMEDEHGEEMNILEQYLEGEQGKNDGDEILTEILAYQWVLDVPIQTPKLMPKDVDKFIKQLARELVVNQNIIIAF